MKKSKIPAKTGGIIKCAVLFLFVFNFAPFSNAEPSAPNIQNNLRVNKFSSGDKPSMFAPLSGSGATAFLPDIQINQDDGNLVDDMEPSIVVTDDGIIYVTWCGDDNHKVYFSKSVDGGVTFSLPATVNDVVSSFYNADIAIDSVGNIYIVWHDYRRWNSHYSTDVYLSKSTDGGLTWGANVKVSDDDSGSYPWKSQPYIAIDQNNGNIYVSFLNYNNYYSYGQGVAFARSTDGGATFEPSIEIDDSTASDTYSWSSVAVDPITGEVYVALEDSRNGDKDVFLFKSVDYGITFGAGVIVNDVISGHQDQPMVRVDNSGAVYAVWRDARDGYELDNIYITKSTDKGNSFEASVKVSDQYLESSHAYAYPPRLAIDNSGAVHIVWYDEVNFNCYYDWSSDGQTFQTDIVVQSDLSGVNHYLPRIAVDGNDGVYVVWEDGRNGNDNFDAFFTRSVVVTHTISGTVDYYDGVKTVSNATVILEDNMGTQLDTTMTDSSGYYEFTGLVDGNDYVVRIEKEDNIVANGVNVLDLTNIVNHIIKTEPEPLDSIFKKISADVNEDEAINVLDLTNIVNYIIGSSSSLLSGNWKFYPSDANLTEENYLFEGTERTYLNLSGNMIGEDFTGIKMGDVNSSWVDGA